MNARDIDPNFLYALTEKSNELLEQNRQRGRAGKYPSFFPAKKVRMCLAEVEAVLEALDATGVYTPPMYEEVKGDEM